jgi:hypothetical protein
MTSCRLPDNICKLPTQQRLLVSRINEEYQNSIVKNNNSLIRKQAKGVAARFIKDIHHHHSSGNCKLEYIEISLNIF